jgi:NRAMP (natural resistance-associated macrophage protein)-like metal ion transporter
MLIVLQHNAAHLGITTGYCLSESTSIFLHPVLSKFLLWTATLAAISTALAEVLGGAIALNMLFKIPLKLGALLVVFLVIFMIFTNSYKKLEKWIIGFVSLIGLSFIIELAMVNIDWKSAAVGWVTPSFPGGSIPIIMSVLAVFKQWIIVAPLTIAVVFLAFLLLYQNRHKFAHIAESLEKGAFIVALILFILSFIYIYRPI